MEEFKGRNKNILICLTSVVVIAFLIRFILLTNMNFYYDEANYAMIAKDFVYNSISPWVTASWQPPLFTWINSIPVRLLGVNEFSMRISSVIFGTLSILLIYYFGQLLFDKKTGLLATMLLAVLPLHVIYSRTAFSDVIQAFFILASIFVVELVINKKIEKRREHLLLLLAGVLLALSFLLKFNSVVVLGLYWTFNLAYPLFKKNKENFYRILKYFVISNFVAFVLVLGTILFTGGIPRLIYVINNFLFLTIFQSTQIVNPFYYHFLVLFDGLSPLLFLLFIISILFMLAYKNKIRSDYLLFFLIITYFLIITLQSRRFARHQIIILPFLIVMLSRYIIIILPKIKNLGKYIATIFISLLIFSSGAWTIMEISKTVDFNVWSQVKDYINVNYPENVTLHSNFVRGRPIRYYLQRDLDVSEKISTLKKGDLVLMSNFQGSTIPEDSPFEDYLYFYKQEKISGDPNFRDYVINNGILIKTLFYKGGDAVRIYKIKNQPPLNLPEKITEYEIFNTTIFGLWNVVCNTWNKNGVSKKIILKTFSNDQIDSIKKRCS